MTKPVRLALATGLVLAVAAIGLVLYVRLSIAHLGFLTPADVKVLLAAANAAKLTVPLSQTGLQTKTESQIISRVRIPTYLAESMTQRVVLPRDIGIRGDIALDVLVGKDGTVVNVRGLSGDSRLLRAAKPAVMKWAFTPYFLNGEPVQFISTLKFQFDGNKRFAKLEIDGRDPLSTDNWR